MGAIKLTDKSVSALACPAGRKDALFFDTETRGFGIRLTEGGSRIFLFQYRLGSKVRRTAIGAWPELTVAKARKLAEQRRGEVVGGGDPVAEQKAKHEATLAAEAEARQQRTADAYTVAVAVEQWKTGRLCERSPAYAAEAPRRLKTALKTWLETPAAGLSRAAVVQALDLVKANDGPIAANRVRAYGRSCFAWLTSRGSLEVNPFATVPMPAVEHSRDRVLTDAELALVWKATEKLGDTWRPLVKLLILTGQRRGEVAGMRWDELAGETWHLPAERTKNGHAHDLPLPDAARAIIAAVKRFEDCPLVFSEGRDNPPSGFGKVKERLDAYIAAAVAEATPAGKTPRPFPSWTFHDLRRTVATGLQRLGVRLEVTEAVLNHVSGSRGGIVGVYQRHAWTDEKRAALDAWAKHVNLL